MTNVGDKPTNLVFGVVPSGGKTRFDRLVKFLWALLSIYRINILIKQYIQKFSLIVSFFKTHRTIFLYVNFIIIILSSVLTLLNIPLTELALAMLPITLLLCKNEEINEAQQAYRNFIRSPEYQSTRTIAQYTITTQLSPVLGPSAVPAVQVSRTMLEDKIGDNIAQRVGESKIDFQVFREQQQLDHKGVPSPSMDATDNEKSIYDRTNMFTTSTSDIPPLSLDTPQSTSGTNTEASTPPNKRSVGVPFFTDIFATIKGRFGKLIILCMPNNANIEMLPYNSVVAKLHVSPMELIVLMQTYNIFSRTLSAGLTRFLILVRIIITLFVMPYLGINVKAYLTPNVLKYLNYVRWFIILLTVIILYLDVNLIYTCITYMLNHPLPLDRIELDI